jgi:hypothetical protein
MQGDVRQGKVNSVDITQFKTENVQIWLCPAMSVYNGG